VQAAGECSLVAPAASRPGAVEAPARNVLHVPRRGRRSGLGEGRLYFGFASAGLDLALTAAVIATNPHQPGTSRTIGSWAVAVFGVDVP